MRLLIVTAGFGLLLSACGSQDEPLPPERLATAADAIAVGALGSNCASSAACGVGLACFAGGACLCKPGLSACDAKCYDLASDPLHCGTCSNACLPGVTCARGLCAAGITPLSPTVDPPLEIDGAGSSTACIKANEGYPEASINVGTAQLVMSFQAFGLGFTPYNWGSAWNVWSSAAPLPSATGFTAGADSWATTAGNTGLEYVARIEY